MPGTRKKTVSKGSASLTTAEDAPSPQRAKPGKERRKPDTEQSKTPETAATSPPANKRRKRAAAAADDEDPASGGEKKLDKKNKSAAAPATPGRPGRPSKHETAETLASRADGKGTTVRAEDKAAVSTPKEGESPSTAVSPRRSSRSVVPNSRFKDMDLSFGVLRRKRRKGDDADEPPPKVRTYRKKDQSSEKEKNSPVKWLYTPTPVESSTPLPEWMPALTATTTTTATTTATTTTTPDAHMASPSAAAVPTPVLSPSSSSSSSSSPSHPVMSPSKQTAVPPSAGRSWSATASSSPLRKRVSRTLPKPVPETVTRPPASVTRVPPPPSSSSSRTSVASVDVHSQLSVGSVSGGSVSVLSPSLRPGAAVSVSSSVVASRTVSASEDAVSVSVSGPASSFVTAPVSVDTSSSSSVVLTSVSRAAAPTRSSFLLLQPPEETALSGSSGAALGGEQTATLIETGGEEDFSPVTVPQGTEADMALVADLTEAVEVEIVEEREGGSDLVPLTPSPASVPGQRGAETPGRVVSKASPSPTSKAVFIVRPAGSHLDSSSSDSLSPERGSLLSAALTEAAKVTATAVEKEAGVGEVTSMVELSPSRKVPVVVAERKEPGGKVVKVIASSQQRPPAVQKVVSGKMSVKEGAVSLLQPQQQQQQTAVTVRIAAPGLSTSGSADSNSRTVEVVTAPSSLSDQESSVSKTPAASTSASASAAAESRDSKADSSGDRQVSAGPPTVSCAVEFSDNDTAEEEEREEGREGLPAKEKYVTSGTQTPYTKNFTKKVITVHVHPPSKDGEKNTEIVTVTREEKEDPSDDLTSGVKDRGDRKAKVIIVDLPEGSSAKQPYVQCLEGLESGDSIDIGEEREEGREEGKEVMEGDKKFIIVDLPEGSTVKQQYARRAERIDSDPDFYSMDEKGLFTCNICQYQTYRRPNFYKHKKKHLGLRPYSCDQCSYRAATTSNLKRHQEIHKDIRNHKCPICNVFFRQKIHLERHIKYRHEEKKVRCPLCEYVCANENPDLKVHLKRRHFPQMGSQELENPFKCRECGAMTNSKKDLRQHLKFHSKGPELKLFCSMCSFVTDCESRLRRHQYIHTKEKPFQCGLCEYRGSQKEHVLRHMRTQHHIEIERKHRVKKPGAEKGGAEAEGEVSKGPEKVDYTSDEKIFACNHCNMKFSKLINLYKHLHTQHRDIMPTDKNDFSCVVCDFRTCNKKNLLVHMRRHNVTDQSPPSHVYSCVLCRYMNPKRRNLFQHMRKKHHIEIVIRDDGSSTCYVSSDPMAAVSGSNGGLVGSHTLSSQSLSHSSEPVVSILPLTDLISTVTQPSELQVAGDATTITMTTATTATMPTTIKMEDLALVVSNPNTATATAMATAVGRQELGLGTTLVEGSGGSSGGGGGGVGVGVEAFSMGAFSQDDAAEAIQGLQALAHRGVLDSSVAMVEEQVQVMGSDDQTTLVIDPAGLSVVDHLVQPKAEPLQVVEIDSSHLLDHDPSSSSSSTSLLTPHHHPHSLLGDPTTTTTPPMSSLPGDASGLQLSAEQLMNLSTGDYLEINGEMFKVEVSTEGSQGQQIISFEPAAAAAASAGPSAAVASEDLADSLEPSEVSLESTPELA